MQRMRDVATMLADVSPYGLQDDVEAMLGGIGVLRSLYTPICRLLKVWEGSVQYATHVRPLVQDVADDPTGVAAGLVTCAHWSNVKRSLVLGTGCARITVTAEGDVLKCGSLAHSWLRVTSICNPENGGALQDLDLPVAPSDFVTFIESLIRSAFAPCRRAQASADAFERACRAAKSLELNPRDDPTEWRVTHAQVLVVFQTASRREDVRLQQARLGPMRLGWMVAVARSVSQRAACAPRPVKIPKKN